MSSAAEQILRWADPEEGRFSGYACSAEEMRAAWLLGRLNRQNFAYQAIVSELARRGGGQVAEHQLDYEYVDFSALPAKSVIDRDDFIRIAESSYYENKCSDQLRMQKIVSVWNRMLQRYSEYTGLGHSQNKYHPLWFNPCLRDHINESEYEKALRLSEEYKKQNYHVRLLTSGSNYLTNCALDVEVLDVGTVSYALVSGVEQSMLWEYVVRRKREEDEADGALSFADQVRTLAPNVFLAPYVTDEVYRHPDYFTHDNLCRACINLGASLSKATTIFKRVVLGVIEDQSVAEKLAVEHFPQSPYKPNAKPGIIFAHTRVLEDYLDSNSCSEAEEQIIMHVLRDTSRAVISIGLD
jgi:hypothetical protein